MFRAKSISLSFEFLRLMKPADGTKSRDSNGSSAASDDGRPKEAIFGNVLGKAASRKRRILEFGIRPFLLKRKIRHLSGPNQVHYGRDELLVICVVRNGEAYIDRFVEHYLALGAKHLVFLDNGSEDDTVDLLCRVREATVLQSAVPYKKFENTMKRYLAERFSKRRWNLCADIDELFAYPFSSRLSLRRFLGYLNANSYSAVAAQMLDMFPDGPLSALPESEKAGLLESNPYYDISDIRKTEYCWSKRSNPAIKMHWGGIRKKAFGTDNGLTKTPLVLMDGNVRPFITWHHALGARMADISCLLFHYPFLGGFRRKVEEAARTGRYGFRVTDEYAAYKRGLDRYPELSLRTDTAQRFSGLERLIEDGFLIVSRPYLDWVKRETSSRE